MFKHFSEKIIFSDSKGDSKRDKSTKNLQDLRLDSSKIASILLASPLTSRFSKIGIFLDDTYEFIAALFGTILAHKEPYLLNSPSNAQNDMLLLDSKFLNSELFSQNLVDKNPLSKNLGGGGGGNQKLSQSLSQKPFDSGTQSEIPPKIPLDKARFFIQTSGSSGEPKFIAKNIYQMLCEAKFLAEFFHLNDYTKAQSKDDMPTFIGAIPHRHLFGLTFKVFLPLVCGGVVLKEQFLYHHFLINALDTHKNVILLASPTALDIVLKDDISKIPPPKAIFCAGSPLDSRSRAGLEKRFGYDLKHFVEIYGSSETGIIGYQAQKYTPKSSTQSTFHAFPPVKLKLDSSSRLVISSAWLDSFEGEKAEFLSNDCAKIHSNGTFTLLGRYDRIIKLNETRISLDFVESSLKSSNLIENVRVGKLDGQNRLSAIIVLSDEGKKVFRLSGKKGIKSAIKSLLQSNAPLMSALRYFHIRSYLPYNEQGKITLKAFRDCANAKITPTFCLISQNISSNEVKTCTLEAYIDEGCFYFDGHFADFPLVPGFVELGFALDCASEYLDTTLESISKIQSVKFSSFLRPCDNARLELERSQNRLVFTLYANDKICSSGKIELKEIKQ